MHTLVLNLGETLIYPYRKVPNGVVLVRKMLKTLIIFAFYVLQIFMDDNETQKFHVDVGDA